MATNPQTASTKPIRHLCSLIISVAFAVFLFGCNDSPRHDNKAIEMNDTTLPISEEVKQAIQKIKNHRILFAHHSVGENILDGLKTLAKKTGVDLKIEQIDTVPLTANSKFVDFSPGQNTNPKSKIDAFAEQIKNLNSDFIPEIAFLKFCYIDFSPDTNVKEILAYYKENKETLKKRKPEITFVHVTVPLTTQPNDFKSSIKRLLGMQVWEDASNISRTEFNDLLHKTFPEDPIFNIARIESTRSDGSRTEFTHNGKTYYSLAPEYTYDGGHLNTLGKHVTASELVVFLANTLKTKKP